MHPGYSLTSNLNHGVLIVELESCIKVNPFLRNCSRQLPQQTRLSKGGDWLSSSILILLHHPHDLRIHGVAHVLLLVDRGDAQHRFNQELHLCMGQVVRAEVRGQSCKPKKANEASKTLHTAVIEEQLAGLIRICIHVQAQAQN